MIKEKSFGYKYVNVHANNISSWSANSEGTFFSSGVDIEQSRNSETNVSKTEGQKLEAG
jgi:hypothetical protein